MESKVARKRPSQLNTQYLIIYNTISAFLWFVIFGRTILLVPLIGFSKVYGGVGIFTKWTQTLALLEVVHSVLGVVRSPVQTTVLQVSSRLLLVWGIVDQFPRYISRSPAYSTMLLAWSITEIIRYSYFALSLYGWVPGFVTWLRYNTFFILYPMGILSETCLIYRAIKPAGAKRREYEWALEAILFIYIPGSYILFTHMMKQRRKVLRGKAPAKSQ